ncbi:energy transducer TonB [Flavobacterium selenitireducens]|uniref:energy transducer TonB n=1 Tax=Flavobacterium selenitireducens TaxID=2722704 RepID=UPI00168ADBF8|nr:energy transducer TonB [Flavobacterium selenitireducens]
MAFHMTDNQKKSLGITAAVFVLVFLLLAFIKFTDTMILNPELMEEGGGGGGDVAVNFGDSDYGMGDNFKNIEPVKQTAKATPQPKASSNEILASDLDDAPAVIENRKTSEKPKKTEEPLKPVEKPAPKPSKSTTDALSDLLNGSSKGGDGDDNRAGNKGKSDGDPYARGYNGGGGSGGGKGGGNGTGEGIGSGSGYGGGSGSGRGSGTGPGNYSLGNRKALSKPPPKYLCNEEGTVAVKIYVDRNGKVIRAEAGDRGTTNRAKCLADQAERAALDTKWEIDSDAPETQVGKIVYNFKLTD